MALVDIEGNDPWLSEYDTCEKFFREIMEQLTLRNREARSSQTFAQLSVNIRICMKKYTSQVHQLKNKVDLSAKQRIITCEEAERRMRLVEQLQSKDVQMHQIFESRRNESASNSSALVNIGTINWGIDEDDDEPLDIQDSTQEIKAHQRLLIEEQDRGLDTLSKVISKQKQIAQTIHEEVDYHNEIIDDLVDHMDRTDQRLIQSTRTVDNISRKSSIFGYWIVIFVLLLIIIVIISV